MCFDFLYNFVRIISHSKNNSETDYYKPVIPILGYANPRGTNQDI
jgi:hypothetical protein